MKTKLQSINHPSAWQVLLRENGWEELWLPGKETWEYELYDKKMQTIFIWTQDNKNLLLSFHTDIPVKLPLTEVRKKQGRKQFLSSIQTKTLLGPKNSNFRTQILVGLQNTNLRSMEF